MKIWKIVIALISIAAFAVVGLLVAPIDSGSVGVENWDCAVTDDYNATAGGGALLEGGNCAVAVAGCRRQAACEIHTKPDVENLYILENLNMSDPELQRRLR